MRLGGDIVASLMKEVLNCIENNPFFRHIGFEIVNEREGDILLKLSLKEELLNTNKTLHGGVHASMLDTVQALALRSLYQCPVAAMNLDVHYFAAVNSGDLFARAKILQKGYKLATIEAEITDCNNQIIAKGTGVYKIIRQS